MNGRIIQFPQRGKKAGGQSIHICFQTVGQRIAAFVQGQFLLKAKNTVAGFEMAADICTGLFPGTGAFFGGL